MSKKALLVVDVQTALVEAHPYNEETLIKNIKELIENCRKNSIEVIYVRHDGGKGDELEPGTRGWDIFGEIYPAEGEKIFEKQFSSSFRNTGLKEYLDERDIKTIIQVGMQVEYCMDATCKVAFEYGYEVIVPEGTTSTFDSKYMTAKEVYEHYVHNIWDRRFAKVVSMEEAKGFCVASS